LLIHAEVGTAGGLGGRRTNRSGAFPSQEAVGDLFEAASPAARPDVIAAVALAETEWSEQFVSTLTTGDLLLKEVVEVVADGALRSVL